jgi:3-oxoacyl-[acyl-carrier protein] reductase
VTTPLLDQRTAVVTGAGQGIGREIARLLTEHGPRVVAADVNGDAGVTRDASLKKMTVDDFDTVITVHLLGTWLGVREASAVMREAKSGSIINISSLSGKSGNPGQTNYSPAKAGIVGLTKAAAKELAQHNLRVNAVQPGLIRTAMTEAMPPEVFADREAAIPMKRAGQAGEVVGAVVFLASGLSSYVTGAVIGVSGGRLM